MFMKSSFLVLVTVTASVALIISGEGANAADHAPAPPAAKGNAKGTKGKAAPTAKAGPGEVTLKGELTCAKCGLHESDTCQNVLRVKATDGAAEAKYYLTKNAVSEENHSKVCGGFAPATITGKITDVGGKKFLAASTVKFD